MKLYTIISGKKLERRMKSGRKGSHPRRVRFPLREQTVTETEEEFFASFRQAKLLMQAGINSSLAGKDDDALALFVAAQRRFTKLKRTLDAGIAGAWIHGLKKHQHTLA